MKKRSILNEDDYLKGISNIVERDYFPLSTSHDDNTIHRVSLDQFLSNTTSADNDSYSQIESKNNELKRKRLHSIYLKPEEEKASIKDGTEDKMELQLRDHRPKQISNSKEPIKNALMYLPDAHNGGLTSLQIKEQSQKKIIKENSRFKIQPRTERINTQPTVTNQQCQPNVKGYTFIESTPTSTSDGHFNLQDIPRQDKIHESLIKQRATPRPMTPNVNSTPLSSYPFKVSRTPSMFGSTPGSPMGTPLDSASPAGIRLMSNLRSAHIEGAPNRRARNQSKVGVKRKR